MPVQVEIRQPKKRYFFKFKMKLLSVLRKLNPFYKSLVPLPKSIPPSKPPVQFVPTSNFSIRKKHNISCIVLHHTGSLDTEKALEWFRSEVSQTSTHYLITREGNIIQLVRDSDRAWHVSSLIRYSEAQRLVNVSLSIHLVGDNLSTFTEEQNASLTKLCKYLLHIYHLPPSSIYPHSYFEPSKECPALFDIQKFRLQLK
jgi:N-acetyl-anhydromuramyl-L-alanine amidase AmpD